MTVPQRSGRAPSGVAKASVWRSLSGEAWGRRERPRRVRPPRQEGRLEAQLLHASTSLFDSSFAISSRRFLMVTRSRRRGWSGAHRRQASEQNRVEEECLRPWEARWGGEGRIKKSSGKNDGAEGSLIAELIRWQPQLRSWQRRHGWGAQQHALMWPGGPLLI
jgi:hypothetical protein